MTVQKVIFGGFAVALLPSVAVQAAIVDQASSGFTVSETLDISAPPDRVYASLLVPSRWWSSEHTYSHEAANLSLDARAGGCWCEKLANGGSVQHLVVVNVVPEVLLRLRGALGPLQGLAVDGAMTFHLRPAAYGSQITITYAVGGYSPEGFGDLAKAVDSVIGEQAVRLKRLVETGTPESNLRPTKQGE